MSTELALKVLLSKIMIKYSNSDIANLFAMMISKCT
jgi:hypothetical protein